MSIWSLTYERSVFKRYHSGKHFSRSLPTRRWQKSNSIDIEENYVTVALCMVWYGTVNVDLYSAITTKVSNALTCMWLMFVRFVILVLLLCLCHSATEGNMFSACPSVCGCVRACPSGCHRLLVLWCFGVMYTVRQKQNTKFLPITPPNVNRFSKLFHC